MWCQQLMTKTEKKLIRKLIQSLQHCRRIQSFFFPFNTILCLLKKEDELCQSNEKLKKALCLGKKWILDRDRYCMHMFQSKPTDGYHWIDWDTQKGESALEVAFLKHRPFHKKIKKTERKKGIVYTKLFIEMKNEVIKAQSIQSIKVEEKNWQVGFCMTKQTLLVSSVISASPCRSALMYTELRMFSAVQKVLTT